VDGSQVSVFKEGDKVSLGGFLESHHSRGLEAEIGLTSHEVSVSHKAMTSNDTPWSPERFHEQASGREAFGWGAQWTFGNAWSHGERRYQDGICEASWLLQWQSRRKTLPTAVKDSIPPTRDIIALIFDGNTPTLVPFLDKCEFVSLISLWVARLGQWPCPCFLVNPTPCRLCVYSLADDPAGICNIYKGGLPARWQRSYTSSVNACSWLAARHDSANLFQTKVQLEAEA
jgi:hypothetical protein